MTPDVDAIRAALAATVRPESGTLPSPPVRAADHWINNADLIRDVARLGYLDGWVLDPTYGRGLWWTEFRPAQFTFSDLRTGVDFRALPHEADTFNSVAYDPPYKLNGTPGGDVDDRYGVGERTRWQDRMSLCIEGGIECARVLRPGGYLLWKCQDQVCSGKVRWQTDIFTTVCYSLGLEKVDRFDMLGTSRQQPPGRRQVHAHGRPSTLLVFQK